jgi:ABC-2 type transport system ATP-binding protein
MISLIRLADKSMITVESFSKAYTDAIAVSDLSFEVKSGQVLGLVGSNGAGKTTTLKSITGIIPASKGKLCVRGYSLADNPIDVKQRTAYVPDDPELFQDLSVEQHLLFTASVYGIANPHEEMADLLSLFELEHKRHSPASGLSRGMRQKLAICCAYLQRPDALLLDEPMTGLDPQGIRMLKQSITDQAKNGAAVVISSHLLAMVEDICSHVLILDRGTKKFLGTINSLKETFSQASGSNTSSLEEIYFAAVNNESSLASSTVSQ